MRRREFIAGLGATAWPAVARAQQPATPVIGYLSTSTPELYARRLPDVRRGLGEVGYLEGQNLAIECGWADRNYDRLPALAAKLVRRHVSAIVLVGGPPALVAKAATRTIPIVFGVETADARVPGYDTAFMAESWSACPAKGWAPALLAAVRRAAVGEVAK